MIEWPTRVLYLLIPLFAFPLVGILFYILPITLAFKQIETNFN